MLKVAIATLSGDKINGVKEAVSKFFNKREEEIEFYCRKIESEVSNQPFEDETYQGAKNRVDNIRNELPGMDLYISCEAGIDVNFYQYFNVQVVCVYNNRQESYLWGKSGGWPIPAKDIEEVRQTDLDIYLRKKTGITCIEELLGTENSRKSSVAQATLLALASGRLLEKESHLIKSSDAEQAADTYAQGLTTEGVSYEGERLGDKYENRQNEETQR